MARCLKITEKVSFNIASEASYVYILSGQKLIKNAKNGFWKPEACGQTVLPDRSILKGQKLVENAKIKNSNATFWVIFKHCAMMAAKLTLRLLPASEIPLRFFCLLVIMVWRAEKKSSLFTIISESRFSVEFSSILRICTHSLSLTVKPNSSHVWNKK